jgi:hypothetical protein
MANNITLISSTITSNLSPSALAQIIPSSVQLPITSQFPAATIIKSANGSPVGISGYAQGYASVVYSSFDNPYDAGSNNFPQNVSGMTLGQIFYTLNYNTAVTFGAVQVNFSKLQTLCINNPTLYLTATTFSPDIQSAMMTDLAILNTSSNAVSYAISTYNFPGVSDALAYYAAQYGIDPLLGLKSYDPNNTTITMGNIFNNILSSAPTAIQNATVYAIVNGLSIENGGLGLFQGFNSWYLYPSDMTGTNNSGEYIQTITLPGRGNNPGLTNNSQEPINAIGYSLDQINFLTQQSLTQAIGILNSLQSVDSGTYDPTLNILSNQATSALQLTTSTISTYSAAATPQQIETIAQATLTLTTAYNAYQANPSNPVLEANLNIAISTFIQVETSTVNMNDSITNAYSQLNLGVGSLANLIIGELNPFPPLQVLQESNPNYLTQSFANTTIQGATLGAAINVAGGNISVISNSAVTPSFVTNPALAIYTAIGQQIELSPSTLTSNISVAGNKVYQNLTTNSATISSTNSAISSSPVSDPGSNPGSGSTSVPLQYQALTFTLGASSNVRLPVA